MTNPAQACMNCLTKHMGICLPIEKNTDNMPEGLFSNEYLDQIKKICLDVCESFDVANQIKPVIHFPSRGYSKVAYSTIKGEGGHQAIASACPEFINNSWSAEAVIGSLNTTLPYIITALVVGTIF